MRLDHIAYRVYNKDKARQFFETKFGYKLADKFDLEFDDGSACECYALSPPEKESSKLPLNHIDHAPFLTDNGRTFIYPVWHMAPEIFISEGDPDSIVMKWLRKNGGPGIHHLAYAVESVEDTMKEWTDVEFLSDKPLECPGLIQVFTKPHPITGVTYELIQRTDKGFCKENVKGLMESTDG